jgi:hypothetical protein
MYEMARAVAKNINNAWPLLKPCGCAPYSACELYGKSRNLALGLRNRRRNYSETN